MRKTLSVLLLMLLVSVFAFSQETSKAEVFGGYQWTNVDTGSGGDRLNFNGWNAALSGYFNKSFGITADFSGAYKNEGGADAKVYTYMFGPTFRAPMAKATPFAHALFGAAHGSAGLSGFGSTSENAFAYAIGGGFDFNANKKFAVRVAQFDYLGTHFGGENQSNFRYSGGVVFKF